MLEVKYIDNENILKPLYTKLFPEQKIAGVNAVLYENEKAIGVCCMAVNDIVEIKYLILHKTNLHMVWVYNNCDHKMIFLSYIQNIELVIGY